MIDTTRCWRADSERLSQPLCVPRFVALAVRGALWHVAAAVGHSEQAGAGDTGDRNGHGRIPGTEGGRLAGGGSAITNDAPLPWRETGRARRDIAGGGRRQIQAFRDSAPTALDDDEGTSGDRNQAIAEFQPAQALSLSDNS